MPATMPRDRVVYSSIEDVLLLSSPRAVVFTEPMPGPYDVYFLQPPTGIQVTSITNQTLNGFTINFTISLAGSIKWVAVERR